MNSKTPTLRLLSLLVLPFALPALGCDEATGGVDELNLARQRAETWRASRCETVVDP